MTTLDSSSIICTCDRFLNLSLQSIIQESKSSVKIRYIFVNKNANQAEIKLVVKM